MYDILTLNKISKTGLERFTDEYQYGDAVENPQGHHGAFGVHA